MRRIPIDVDQEVFEFLQRQATPFVDSPNDVLRRLLLREAPEAEPRPEIPVRSTAVERSDARRGLTVSPDVSVEAFVDGVVRQRFGDGFKRRAPYRMMFESRNAVLYFQNFNKETNHLWYRVTENPWRDLQSSKKEAWLCLSNPAEGYCYVIPVKEIQARVQRARWGRPFLEINIDPATSRWSELDWKLDDYLMRA